jgi:multiple sugar transport system ATP-binding protein
LAERPGLERFIGSSVILGIRPETFEDAELAADAPADRRFRTRVELREALGSEVLVHFALDVPPVVTEDTQELARDSGMVGGLEPAGAGSTFVARLDPRTGARERADLELAVDTSRLHFFDPESGLGIHNGEGETPVPVSEEGGKRP